MPPPILGELNLVPPLGWGVRGLTDQYCVSPDKIKPITQAVGVFSQANYNPLLCSRDRYPRSYHLARRKQSLLLLSSQTAHCRLSRFGHFLKSCCIQFEIA